MSTLSERLRNAMSKAGLSVMELARRSGVKHSTVSFWLSGKTKTMSATNANAAARALGVNVRWLIEGVGDAEGTAGVIEDGDEPPDGFVAVPLYQIRFAAGDDSGEPTYEELTDSEPRYFSRAFLQTHHLCASQLRCFRVSGSSMEPTLFSGDVILVDCSYQPILDGRVYAFGFLGALRVKRLYKRLSGALLIRSDNADKDAFPDETLQGTDLQSFRLIGRVIERAGTGNL